MIMVTHHVEEIRPWISHVLLVREGRVLAGGPAENVLTSDRVSAAFAHPFVVESVARRYYIRGADTPV